jgi:biopolymer transport protein TolQ
MLIVPIMTVAPTPVVAPVAAPVAVAAKAAGKTPIDLSPINLFLGSGIVEQVIMILLLIASLWTWTIIFAHILKISKVAKASERFERDFWKAGDVDAFAEEHKGADMPSAKVFQAGLHEWRRSTNRTPIDRDGTRERLATRMGAAVAAEVDKLGDSLNILATVGSIAPFVGLLGTVWGIMESFAKIGEEGTPSFAVVAPGVSGALLATAIGLFAAIPAVIAYNRFSHGLNKMEARLNRFADGFHATLSRELELER